MQNKKGVPVSGTPFLLLVFNYLNIDKRVSAVPFFVSKKEIIKEKAKVKYVPVHLY